MTLYQLVRGVLAAPIRLVWRLEVRGLEALPPGPCVLAANHESYSDTLFASAAIPRPMQFLAKAELIDTRLGPVLQALGAVPVRRGVGDQGAIQAAVTAVRGGACMLIHPQGTFLGPADRPWRRGAARVALEAGVPLVPVALVNTARVLGPGEPGIGFPRVRVLVGEAIDVGKARPPTPVEASRLTERLRLAVETLRGPEGLLS